MKKYKASHQQTCCREFNGAAATGCCAKLSAMLLQDCQRWPRQPCSRDAQKEKTWHHTSVCLVVRDKSGQLPCKTNANCSNWAYCQYARHPSAELGDAFGTSGRSGCHHARHWKEAMQRQQRKVQGCMLSTSNSLLTPVRLAQVLAPEEGL